MKKPSYTTPAIETISIAVEQGIAASPAGVNGVDLTHYYYEDADL